jgi:hypothetical protein
MANLNQAGARESFREQMQRALDNMEKLKAKGKFKSHSSFWLGEKAVETYQTKYANPETRDDSEYVMALASIRRGIANFVRITTGRDVPVVFSTGQQSYASSREAEQIVISATADPQKFDVNVGIALHEAAHLCKSKVHPDVPGSIPLFEFLDVLGNKDYQFFNAAMQAEMKRLKLDEEEVRTLLKHVINVLEDRRIDQWMYEAAPGYRKYYEALYSFYWMSEKVTKVYDDPKSRIPTVRTYRFHLTNMMNPRSDERALPDLDKIFGLIDLEHVDRFGFDSRWTTYIDAVFPAMTSFSAMLEAGAVPPKKKKGEKLVFPPDSLPEMIQVGVQIVEIILKNSISENITDDMQAPLVLNVPPVLMKGRGLDEEDEDEEEQATPFSVPSYDPENMDHRPSGKDSQNQEEEDAGSPDDGDLDEDEVDDDDNQDVGDDNAPDEKEAIGSKNKAIGSQKLSSKLVKKSQIDKMLDEVMAEQEDVLSGEIEKEDLEDKLADRLKVLEEANTEIKEVSSEKFTGTAKVVIYNKLTYALLNLPKFQFGGIKADYQMDQAIARGINMGNMLAHRLRIMADESPITTTRLTHGKLNKRALAGLGYEFESVFQQTRMERYAPVYLHLTVDSSTSMAGPKFYNSMALAVALAQAAHKIRNLDVTISLRAASTTMCYVLMAYDSRVDSLAHIKTYFRFLHAGGGTPEGLAFAAIKDRLLKDAPEAKKYFLNLSDGMPDVWISEAEATVDEHKYYNRREYRGAPAFAHTNEQVRQLRDAGINILAYYISEGGKGAYDTPESEAGFKQMYGSSAQFIDPASIPQIASTLNKLFLNNS